MNVVEMQSLEDLDLGVWPMFHTMSTHGIRVDVEALRKLREEVVVAREVARVSVAFAAGTELNPNSGDEVAAWMKANGFARGRRTKSGDRLSTDERVLTTYRYEHPLFDAVLEFRGLDKLRAAFIDPLLEKVEAGGPVIHPNWKLTRTRSGRAASEDPNLMAFPSRDEMGRKVRKCFVAREGMVMFSVDFSQIEPRLAAALSGDTRLMAMYREKRDIYSETAKGLFHVEAVDPIRHRLPAKVVTLGVMYGIGGDKLWEELVKWGAGEVRDGRFQPFFSKDECHELIGRWFELYPGVTAYVQRVVVEARRAGGVVLTMGGRMRRLPALYLMGSRWPDSMLREEAERQAFNHRIQGTAQEVMKGAMKRVWDGYATRGLVCPLLQIHDELVAECEDSVADWVPKEVAAVMETREWGMDFVTSYKVAGNWGDLK